MARILDVRPNTQRIAAHKPELGVDCEHQVVVDDAGTTLLHLTTFGSRDRASHRKSSQSLQVDSKVAAELVRVMRETFGDEVLNASPRLDVAFASGGAVVDAELLAQAYEQKPELFRALITNDEAAGDVIAMAHRRRQVERFRRLLEDDDYFDNERKTRFPKRGSEAVWQHFFEENPWIFGVSLSGQLLTSWSDERLEQVVAGHSIASVGKRTDALLRTSGRIRSMVFAEIKTHRKELLEPIREPYRSGCWAPSFELSGGVVQAQGTVHRAVMQIGERLQDKAGDGSDIPGEFTYLLRPRSYLVIGNLDSLRGDGGGYNQDQIRSFELFRRELVEPEILTFDELLARAEWTVESAGTEAYSEP
ncbi:Shedu immune nuclease family protein [Nocardia sp. NPDC088792]|uniref:Shedu immune nuclease family protein n=1 Tax=Nocardia sp. NPDC088792 TaxID=3364332 RepID=UPI0038179F15